MANLKSSKKSIRKTRTQTIRNKSKKRIIKSLAKEIRKLVSEGKKEKALEKYRLFTKKIDKASKSNFYHKNTASRYKSRLAKLIAKLDKA